MAGSMYSWEDFLKELDSSGLRGQFSDADLKLAQANPDVGMGLLGYKKQWNGTTDEELRKRYNEGANALRSSYGGYTGGANGATYLKDPLAPRDFTFRDAPTYTNRYDDRIQELLGAVTDREDFSYDVERDPLYAQYRKQYLREGKRASADAMGQAAAMSGGLPSSFAGTAAGQAANYYNAQLTDKVPELEELAYQKYLNDFDMDRAKLSAVETAEQSDYQKYLTDLNQYNTDRSFAYGQFTDQLSREERDRETAYQRDQDARTRALEEALTGAQFGDYSRLNELGFDTSGYQSNEERQRALEEALTGAQFGDYSRLNELGFDTSGYQSNEERQRALEEAQLRAQYGDLSGLRALGIDTSAYEASLKAASGGSGGGSRSGSGSGSAGSTGTGGQWTSVMARMEAAGVKSGADAYSWALDMGYSATEAKQMQENWENLHKQESGGYQSLFDRAAAAGANSYETARAFFLDQGLSLEEANAMAEDFEAGGYGKQNTSQQGNTVKSGSVDLKEPAANASSRDKFLYTFAKYAYDGTDLDTLAAQLETAVENGWITAREKDSLMGQAIKNNALFFSGKR